MCTPNSKAFGDDPVHFERCKADAVKASGDVSWKALASACSGKSKSIIPLKRIRAEDDCVEEGLKRAVTRSRVQKSVKEQNKAH